MLRALLGGLLCVTLVGFTSAAEAKKEEKKANVVAGKFKSYKDGTLTITTGKKGEETDKTFKVADTLKVNKWDGEDLKKELAINDAFKDLKEGTRVAVTADGDKVSAIVIGSKPKK